MPVSQQDKADRFAALHRRATVFVIPNPWDAGSARLLASQGFQALATTSLGFALTLGRRDGEVSRDEAIEHCRDIAAATDLPVSADLENGFADDPAQAAQTLVRAAEAGVVGGSIEDYSGDPARPIYDFNHAVERVQAAAEAVHALGFRFTFTARAENMLRGRLDLDDTIRRLKAFEAAGADVLYAPGLRSLDDVRAIAAEVSLPLNVLGPEHRGATVRAIGEAGGTRVSLGGALARAAAAAALRVGDELQGAGGFGWVGDAMTGADLKSRLAASAPR